jgi:gliding motility-associated-like protein
MIQFYLPNKKHCKTHARKTIRDFFLIFLLSASIISFSGKNVLSQISVSTGFTPEDYVEFIVGSGITYSNVSYSCNSNSIGYFSTDSVSTNLGFDNGIILSTGLVNGTIPIGSDASTFISSPINCPGDPQLQALIHPYTITEATILEFDFVPVSDTIMFQYVFASEEYHQWVGSAYNDVFGFFLSGPDPMGGNYNYHNIARIPGTNIPVAINTVNNGQSYFPCSTGPCSNCSFFVDNCSGVSIVYDAFTTVLTAWAVVVPCQTYTIKLAIGDAGDRLYDSGVFLMENSFISPSTTHQVSFPMFDAIGSQVIEGGCNNASITFTIPWADSLDTEINFSLEGTAIHNADYLFPDSIIIPSGSTSTTVTLEALSDGINEGVEQVIIIYQNSYCTYDTIYIDIYDYEAMIVSLVNDVEICNGETVTLSAIASGGQPQFFYEWNSGETTHDITVTPHTSTQYIITVTDLCDNTVSAQTNVIVHPNPIINIVSDHDTICDGEAITLSAYSDIPGTSWLWNTGDTSFVIIVSPGSSATYSVTGTTPFGCYSTDTKLITVFQNPAINITGSSLSICEQDSAILTASSDISGTIWQWSTGETINPLAVSPSASTTYTVTGTSPEGCSATTQIFLTVHPLPDIIITNPNPEICFGDSAVITANSSISGTVWSWNTGETSDQINITPLITTYYSVTGTTSQGCSGSAMTDIIVHPNPLDEIIISSPAICEMDTATLTVTGSIPGTIWLWSTGDTGTVINVTPSTTTTYSVTGTSPQGCTGSAEATITVFSHPVITITSSYSEICEQESAVLTASGNIPVSSWEWSTGSTNNNITVSPSSTTTYTVTGTTINGCSGTSEIQITVHPIPQITMTAISPEICEGESAFITADSDIQGTTWVWSTGETAHTIYVTPNTTTTYTVTGTSQQGCTASSQSTIIVHPDPVDNITAIPTEICEGSTTVLTANSSIPGIDWTWSTGETTTNITVSPNATTYYSVTGTSLIGCSGSAEIEIIVHPLPAITVMDDTITICEGETAELFAISDIPATSWTWNTGAPDNPLTVSPGSTTTYTVTGTTPQGCTGSADVLVIVHPDPVDGILTSQAAICDADTVSLEAYGSVPGTTWEWDTGDSTAIIIVTPNTTTTYTVTGTSPQGCTGSAEATIIVFDTPIITIVSYPAEICEQDSATLTASSNIPGTSWQWSTGDTNNPIVVTPGTTTTYTVTGTVTAGCSGTAEIEVEVYPVPNITLTTPSPEICQGQTTDITADSDIPGTTWQWSTGDTTQTIYVSPNASTTYSVTGTSPNGCTAEAQISIVVYLNPVDNITASPMEICEGDASTLTANSGIPGTTWVWSTGDTINPITVSPGSTTTYTVTGTSPQGCSGTAEIEITVHPLPAITVMDDTITICEGETAELFAISDIPATSWTWNTGAPDNPLTVSPGSTTTYTVTGTTPQGCTGSADVLVIVHPDPVDGILTSQAAICDADTVSLEAYGSVPGTTWEWDTGDSTAIIIVTPNTTTTYTVTGTSPQGCTGSAEATIIVFDTPIITIVSYPAEICEQDSATLTASSNIPGTSWQWSTGDTNNPIVVTPGTTTTYTVTGTVTAGCSGTAEIEVEVYPVPNITLTTPSPEICQGQTTDITADSDIPGTTWQWSTGDTTQTIYVSPNASTTYSVTGTSPNGCTAEAQISIVVYLNPVDNITASPMEICEGDASTLTANSGIPGTTWVWSTGDTINPITVSPGSTTTYTVTGTSPQGCSGTAEIEITVYELPLITTWSDTTNICPGTSVNLYTDSNIPGTTWNWSSGNIGSPVTVNPGSTTTYTVTGTTPQGCSSTGEVTITVYDDPVQAIISSSIDICEQDTAILTAVGGVAGTIWTWSTGETTNPIFVSPATTTTYGVTAVSPDGCTGSAQITINVVQNPVESITATQTDICLGGSTTLTANSNMPGTTWQWSTGDITNPITVSPNNTTTYTVTGTAPIGCSGTAEIEINVHPVPDVSITLSNPEICIGDTVVLTAHSDVPGTTWEWNTGDTDNPLTLTPTTTSVYIVTGTSPQGCTASSHAFVIVLRDPIDFIYSATSPVCAGDTAIITIFSSSAGATFMWNTGDTTNPLVVTPHVTTIYSVTGTSPEGCTGTADLQIMVNPLPVVNITSAPPSICIGGSASLTADADIPVSDWIWSTGDITNPINVAPAIGTTFSVTVTSTDNCSGSADIFVDVHPLPVITAGSTVAEICEGDSVNIIAGSDISGTTWQWSTGDTTVSAIVSPSVTTTYTVTGTSPEGCSSTSEVTITVHPNPIQYIATTATQICNQATAILTASGNVPGTAWQWSTGETINPISVSPSYTTTYSVTGTSPQGCTGSAEIEILVHPHLNVDINPATPDICSGQTVNLSANSGVNGTSWLWNNGDTNDQITVSPISATTYTVTGTSPEGCTGSAQVTVNVHANPVISVNSSASEICEQDTVTLTATSDIAGTSWLWDNGLTINPITDSPGSTQTYTVTGTTAFGCTGTAQTEVIVHPLPQVLLFASPNEICEGETTQVSASSDITGTTWIWNTGQTTNPITVNPSGTTTYTVTGTTSNGCTASSQILITVHPLPVITAGSSSPQICDYQPVHVYSNSDILIDSWLWNTGDTSAMFVSNPQITTTYQVTGTTINGCTSSAEVTVIVHPNPLDSITLSSSTICEGETVQITANSMVPGTNWTWNTGQISNPLSVSPIATTIYSVTGTSPAGCTGSAYVQIDVNPLPIVTVAANLTEICEGETVQISAISDIPASSWEWSTGATFTPVSVNPQTTTIYTVTATSPEGCSGTAEITILVHPNPNIQISSPSFNICDSGSTTLTAVSDITGTNWQWNSGQTNHQITVNPLASTMYSVTGTTGFGCSASAEVQVSVYPNPVVNINSPNTVICYGDTTLLIADSDLANTTWSWSNGGISNPLTVSPLSTTTYTVTGSTSAGCTGTAEIQIDVIPLPVITAGSSLTEICEGDSVILFVSSSTPGLIWQWSNGQISNTFSDAPSTTTNYTVSGTSPQGCFGTAQTTVIVNPLPVPSILSSSQSLCLGDSVLLTAQSAIAGTDWLWSTGNTINPLAINPGTTTTYHVTGTTPAGCSGSAQIQINVNPVPNLTLNANSTEICQGDSVVLTADTDIPVTNWLWNSGGITNPFTDAPITTTTYTVTGTTNAGCSNFTQLTIIVHPNPVDNITSTFSDICEGESVTLTAHNNVAGISWEWNTGHITNPLTVTPGVNTTYSVTGTNTLTSCSGTAQIQIAVHPVPNVTAGTTSPVICDGQTTYLTANSDIMGTSWLWNTGDTVSPLSITPIATSTYTVTGTTSYGCSSTSDILITVNPVPNLQLSTIAGDFCAGDDRIITAISDIAGTTWLWNTGNTEDIINVQPAQNTTYTVTGTTSDGCSSTASITIAVIPLPDIQLTAQNPEICFGTGTTINATTNAPGASFLWSTGCTTPFTNVQPLSSATYTITVTDMYGCSDQNQIFIEVLPNPVISVTPDQAEICFGSDITLTANSDLPNTSYTWNIASTGQSISVSPSNSTLYTVTGTDNYGCSGTSEAYVNVIPVPMLTVTPCQSTICPGESVTIDATSDTPLTTYEWSNGSTSASVTVTPLAPATYHVTGTAPNGCTGSADAVIHLHQAPVINIVPANPGICPGESITLHANGCMLYSWSDNLTPDLPDGSQVTVIPDSTTQYYIQGIDANGCVAYDSTTVTIHWPPLVDFTTESLPNCAGNPVYFLSLCDPEGEVESYLWNFGDPTAGSENTSTQMNPTHIYMYPGTYWVSLDITSVYGCTASVTKPDFITVHPNPIASFTVTPDITDIVSPHVNVYNQSLGAESYLYDFGDSNAGSSNYSTQEHPFYTYSEAGEYTIWQYVTNQWGCVDSTSQMVTIKPTWQIYFPNAFTPNGDGINDVFTPFGFGVESDGYEMYIYNRWGEEIFFTRDINRGWDGTVKNSSKIAPTDSYVYLVRMKNIHGHTKEFVGSITLIK